MTCNVSIATSGHEFTVDEGESVLDAALRQGLSLPYSCRGGTCGSCKGKVVAGEVDYPHGAPPALSAVERATGMALFCQARPRGDIVIEVREPNAAAEMQVKKLPAWYVSISNCRAPSASSSWPASMSILFWPTAATAASRLPMPRTTINSWNCICATSRRANLPSTCSSA